MKKLINKKLILTTVIFFILGVVVTLFLNQPKQALTADISSIKSSSKQPDLGSKVEQVEKQGFTPYDTSTYDPNSPLNVLIGIATGSADGYTQKAFFFYGDQYLGTDTTDPSITIKLAGRDDKIITLKYILYNSSDVLANPTGGSATVRYQRDGSKLTPLDPIPPTDWSFDGHR